MSLRYKILTAIIVIISTINPLMGEGSTLHPVKRGDRYGYANEQGKMVISARYAIAMEFGEGLAYVAESPDRHGSWRHGFINESGRWVAFLDGKSFRPAETGTVNPHVGKYGGRCDCVVFINGFAELPTYNSTGGQDFETSSVWINRHQMMEMVERFGKETPIRPTSRLFFTRLLRGENHILGVCAKARNTKGPNGVLAFNTESQEPVTTIQAGEENEWFGTFGIMRYTGNTYLVYKEGKSQVRYFDEVAVLQREGGELEFLAKGLGDPFRLYNQEIEPVGEESYETMGQFMRQHGEYMVRESEDYLGLLPEMQSRKLLNFQTMGQLEEYYLTNGERLNTGRIPVCETVKGAAKEVVRIDARCCAVLITDYSAADREAWLLDFSSNSRIKVKLPLEINASGRDGEDGEAGTDGAAGRPKLTYKQGNVTKTEPGTCGEAGGDGEHGEDGVDGATLLVMVDSRLPIGEITINVDGGKGGKGGAAGKGGIHGNGSPCSGKAKDGRAGKDGSAGAQGQVRLMINDK